MSAIDFKPQQQAGVARVDKRAAVMLPAAGTLSLAPAEPALAPVLRDRPAVRWWQNAAMAFGEVGPLYPARTSEAPEAPQQGFYSFKVSGQATSLIYLHTGTGTVINVPRPPYIGH